MRVVSIRFLAMITVVFGLGFAAWSLAIRSPHSPWYIARWEMVMDGMQRMEFVSDDGINVLLYRFMPQDFSLRIENSSEPARVKAWASKLGGESLVINGFYFLEDFSPAGLLITDGQDVHAQEFDLDKSGVVRLEPNFDILDTDQESFSHEDVLEAGQSYPLLFKQGLAAIKEDSGLQARRSFIGTDEFGQAYVGVVWRDDVSLFELMHVLQEIDSVSWYDVMNLDGGPSTGVALEADGYSEILDSAAPVPNVIYIELKK